MSARDRERATARSAHPGDLGRRVVHRREQLGLTREQVAERAGMAVNYLDYLETSPAAIDIDALTRLAGALDTAVGRLLGSARGTPSGPGRRGTEPVPEELAAWECWAKMAPRGVGRVALTTPDGPLALPVNYRVQDATLLYRTTADGVLARAAGSRVAFEVDQLDDALGQGWSVLVTGTAEQVTEPEVLEWLARHADPRPWAGGHRDTWLRIKPDTITGRRIRTPDLPND
ncbi:pyridoxamine 5'-phosphate oxidase family protein [Kitasatospora sp. CMC57]